MIKLNEQYSINNRQGSIVFTEGNKGTVNALYTIAGNKSEGKINGTLDGKVLKGTFHVDAAAGLIEFTFSEDGFDAKWKQGIEPGPMRGKWEGSFESNQSTSNSLFTHDEFYKLTSENRFQKVFEFIENIVQSKDIDAVSEFSDFIKGFVNKNPECFWMILATSQKLDILRIQFEEEAELYDFISEFDSQLTEDLDVDLKEKFNLFFYPNNDGGEWSKIEDGILMTFSEIILSEANLDLSSDNFDWNKYTNYAISHLWIGLQNYTSKNAGRIDEDDLAFCLKTVFEERYEPMSDIGEGCNHDVVSMVITLIMQLDINEFNADENPSDRDDLENYGDYTTDYKKIAEEILNVDIFDLYPY
jgi:hypothetical protein